MTVRQIISNKSICSRGYIVVCFFLFLGVTFFIVYNHIAKNNLQLSDTTMQVLDNLRFWSFPLSFVFFIIFLIRLALKPPIKESFILKPKSIVCWQNIPFKSFTCFVLFFVFIVVTSSIIKANSLNMIHDFLNNKETMVVKINGDFIENTKDIIVMLKTIEPLPAHHSHDTVQIRIEVISNSKSLGLEFGRDSQRPQEYWVFYPKYRCTSKNEIARVKTDLLNEYK